MEKNAIEQFLHAIDDELAKHAKQDERLDWHLLGRSTPILRFGVTLSTKDVDLVTGGDAPELQRIAFDLFGQGTPGAKQWGLYLEGVPWACRPSRAAIESFRPSCPEIGRCCVPACWNPMISP